MDSEVDVDNDYQTLFSVLYLKCDHLWLSFKSQLYFSPDLRFF